MKSLASPSTPCPPTGGAVRIAGEDAGQLLARAPSGMFVVQDGLVAYANDALADMLGVPAAELVGLRHEDTVAPECRSQVLAVMARRLAGKEGRAGRTRLRRHDGRLLDVHAHATRVSFAAAPAVLVTVTDATALDAALHRARWSADMLARTESLCRSGSFEVDLPAGTLQLSEGLRGLVCTAAGGTGSIDTLTWVPDEERGFVAGIWRHAAPGEPFEFQHRVIGADGRPLVVVHRGVVQDIGGGARRGIALLQDITAQRDAEGRAQALATQDPVTGLPNRAAFLDQLDAAVHAARWSSRSVCVLAIDIARIGDVRARMGYPAGDALAREMSIRLRASTRDGEVLARIGDNEFAMLLEAEPAQASAIALQRGSALRRTLQDAVRLADADVFPQCVIGIARFPDDDEDAGALVAHAQTARLNAEAAHGVAVFTPDSNARVLREMRIEAALRHALESGALQLHYQPQIDLSNGWIVGAEALLRWEDAELGAVSPAEFIPVAERADLIGPLGDWVMRRTCEQAAALQRDGLRAIRLGFNLSAVQLRQPDLPHRLERLLLETGADPARLGVELTESAAMADVAQTAALLEQIRALGVEIALDDFGTGYSSLSCLRSLPIDVVKIDRSFVHDVTAAPEDVSVTRALIKLVHGLQLQVLAEGVETEGQLALLSAHACDRMQGFLFSPAVPADALVQMLRDGRAVPAQQLKHDHGARTLLLVDDEANILSALKRLLRRDGYRVITAGSATEGLARLAEADVDVIVSDQRMPGMTGVEFLRRAKALYPDTIRMVLSGFTELQSIIDAVNEGAIYKFLTKPWDDELLRGHVADAFRQKELADENRRLTRQLAIANADYEALTHQLERAVEHQHSQADVLADSSRSLRDAMDALPMPVIGLDLDGTLVFANAQADQLLPGLRGLLGEPATQALPPALSAVLTMPADTPAVVTLAGRAREVRLRPLGPDAARGRLLLVLPPSPLETP